MELNVNGVNGGLPVSQVALTSATEKLAEMKGGAPAGVLSGASLSISGGGTNLEKLLAQMELEDEERRLKLARERLASAFELIQAMNLEQGVTHSEAYTQLDEYATQVEALERAIQAKEREISAQERTVGAAEREVTQATRELNAAQSALETAQGGVQAAEQEVAAAQAEVDGMTQAPGESDEAFAQRQAEAQAALATAQGKLASAQAAAATAGESVASAQTAVNAAQAKVDQEQVKLQTLKDEKQAMQTERDDLNGRIDALWDKLNDDELRALMEAMRLGASDVQSILEKRPDEENEDRETEMVQREAPTSIVQRALDRYEKRLQETIEAKREAMV